jgi:hypothetical protein
MSEDTKKNLSLDETSPSVQAHLGIIQGVIQRMATNSAACKTWCITIVSAILVVVADKQNPNLAWVAAFPTVLFLALDTYYLALEKGFRNSYNSFIRKLHNGTMVAEDLYSIFPIGNQSRLQFDSFKSFSVWGFYLPLIILAVVVKFLVIGKIA